MLMQIAFECYGRIDCQGKRPLASTMQPSVTLTSLLNDICHTACCIFGSRCVSVVSTVRTCFVSDLQRGQKIQEAKFNLDGTAEVNQSVLFAIRQVSLW